MVYQPLIVGLAAVVLTIYSNYRLERFRHSHAEKRRACQVRRMVAMELDLQKESLHTNLETMVEPPPEGHSVKVPVDYRVPVWEHFKGDLGLLETREAAAILKAYTYIQTIPEYEMKIGTLSTAGDIRIALIPRENHALLVRGFGQIESYVDAALAELRKSGD